MRLKSKDGDEDAVVVSNGERAGKPRTREGKDINADRLGWGRNSLTPHWLEPLGALIITKACTGFDRECIDDLKGLLRAIASGKLTELKYLVFDFAHRRKSETEAAEGFEDLLEANAALILDAPVITVAWARSFMAEADLDFALYCSMLVAEQDAHFSFDADPASLFRLYAALARKIGFVKTERLIENCKVLDADDMRNLYLVKEVVEPQEGVAAIECYIRQCMPRYNAAYAIFRAQRMAMPPIDCRFAARAIDRRQ